MLKLYYNAVDCISLNYIEKTEAWNMYSQHYHNGYEFYLLLEGKRKFCVNNQKFELGENELLIIKPYDLHYTQRLGEEKISRYIMNFPIMELGLIFDKKETEIFLEKLESCVIKLDKQQAEYLKELFNNISENIYSNKLLGKKIGVIYIILLIEYLKNLPLKAYTVLEACNNCIRVDMLEAMSFINENYKNSEFDLDDIVKHISMSKSRFCEVFKETTGFSFLKYLTELRLRQAERELWTTDKALKLIAEENGFSSVSNMSRNFIKKFKISPTEYRLKNRNN